MEFHNLLDIYLIFTNKNRSRKMLKLCMKMQPIFMCVPPTKIFHCPTQRHWATAVSNQKIFDRNVKRIQKDRSAINPDASVFEYIKDEVGYRLADRIFDVKREFKVAADIGCGHGFVSRHIMADTVHMLHMCDISELALNKAEGTPGLKICKHVMDEELLNFEPNSLDLVVSSLSLHWVNDLPGCFSTIIRSLKEDGVFLGSMYGGETLYELRSALQLAEIERKGGIAPHISPFTQIRDIGALLNGAGFTMLTIDTDEMTVGYPSMFELMWDLKGMGESNCAFNRPLHLSRDTMMAAAAIYNDMYSQNDGVTATFQIIYFVGWKPAPNQPKPMPRGSANVSLKDLDKIIENDGKIPQ